VEKLKALKLAKASELVKEDIEETLHDMDFPREHWRSLRTDNPLERIMREILCRTRVVGAFTEGNSALMLVVARLRQVAGISWGTSAIWTWVGSKKSLRRRIPGRPNKLFPFPPSGEGNNKRRTIRTSTTRTKVRKTLDTTGQSDR
jgi:transposase-like protein